MDNGIWAEFEEILKGFRKVFNFELDIGMEKSKLHGKFTNRELLSKSNLNVKEALSHSIYSYEKYSLEKLELAMAKDEEFVSNDSFFRHRFGTTLRQHIKEVSGNDFSLLLDSLSNIGVS
ncbi:hypothetical protein IA826_09020 [Listeria seeligeri]|uniref:hypothetical protein n=1 Tax=Listeria seeligeri TaxID=1640 RepID=UPI001623E230|nr:hypothetical protein [Listeria seeligeri]MBC2072001.1 hypothetical protein [Listeria seeligeri]MBC2086969.1 hypothetical protein [Listeria seeligeri]MBC2247424.1 hypothetical protein [Listeria seeligeri]MBF2376888.1 hypothetical protein [Listeria seeligeri]MBF2401858.1 hypothetical protein [Listeria seeligeri]